MARIPVFYSFYFDDDAWRVQQVRNMGIVDGEEPVSANDWESIKRKGDAAVRNWIDEHMLYKRCVVVLVGTNTWTRPWVRYEIQKAWESKKGIVGVRIHGLKDASARTSAEGQNPFYYVPLGGLLSAASIQLHNPGVLDPYNSIKYNLASWVEGAVAAAHYR